MHLTLRSRTAVLSLALLLLVTEGASAASPTISFSERLSAQRAIELVYWAHRTWPEGNPVPRPSLDEILPEAALSQKVASVLERSAAVERVRGFAITVEELQSEMDRMARETRSPEVLRELFGVLGNDPLMIAEGLARPIVADRLLRQIETAGSQARPGVLLPSPSKRQAFALPLIAASAASCTPDTWTETASADPLVTAREDHATVWTGAEMIVWGGEGGGTNLNSGGRYDPATDSWTATSTGVNVPGPRTSLSAVWTGTEMIVWGGVDAVTLRSGGRYNPATDTWTPTTLTGSPSSRLSHTAVWTGTEMIIWGGMRNGPLNTGGRYDPATDTWTQVSTGGETPIARLGHSAVWTGTEMIIWGGQDAAGGNLKTGARYKPSTNSWISTNSGASAPTKRRAHTAVWTGNRMIVWGGVGFASLNTGGRYNPATDTWTPTSVTGAPAGRQNHAAVWTGTGMIVWGGFNGAYLDTGGRYTPSTNSWAPTSNGIGDPEGRDSMSSTWTGSEMIIWGGFDGDDEVGTGGRYCPGP